MIDYLFITVSSGNGGNGAVSFRREKYVAFGGPDGGGGGKGGAVSLVCNLSLADLRHLSGRAGFRAGSGQRGVSGNREGKGGRGLDIEVPAGTFARVSGPVAVDEYDLLCDGQRVVLAEGGEGGRGNKAFATSVMKVPRVAEAGAPGQKKTIELVYKVVSDIALLGVPGAGKSQLLYRITKASAKVSEYYLATVEPVVGVLEEDWRRYSIVEVPSLWFGSSSPGALGKYLKHAERAVVLAILVDAVSENLEQQYLEIRRYLQSYGHELVNKPMILLVNKMDIVENSEEKMKELSSLPVPVYPISAKHGDGVPEAINKMIRLLDESRANQKLASVSSPVTLRPRPRGLAMKVSRVESGFTVQCDPAERIVAGTDMKDWEARAQVLAHLEKLGVHKALERAGARAGDAVWIGRFQMEWQ